MKIELTGGEQQKPFFSITSAPARAPLCARISILTELGAPQRKRTQAPKAQEKKKKEKRKIERNHLLSVFKTALF